jgi:tRNA A58 N-methylase Trm61
MMKSIEDILSELSHKDTVKATTTLQFKKDLVDILLDTPFDGDILEVGTSSGNTTVILATLATILGKKVFGFDHAQSAIDEANGLCKSFDLNNYELIKKDVYEEDWGLSSIGFVLIDCIHTERHFKQDLANASKVSIDGKPLIVAHDYGLVTKDGDTINSYVKESGEVNIVKFIGEESGWNSLGSGKVIDWEGVQLEIKSE